MEEVTPVRSKVTLIEGHRAAKLGVIKSYLDSEFHLPNNEMQMTEHNAALGVTKPWCGSQGTIQIE